MAYTEFVNYLTYQKGSVVSYRGATFVFTTTHTPGDWNPAQVVQINHSGTEAEPNFNTLPDYNLSRPLPLSKFKIIYKQNNDAIETIGNFTDDTQVYMPGEIVTTKDYKITHFSADGLYVYSFAEWNLEKGTGILTSFYKDPESFVPYLEAGVELDMPDHDIVLYAQWTKIPTVTVDIAGRLVLKPEYRTSIIDTLVVPEYFEGHRVKIIGYEAFYTSCIEHIILPASIIKVEEDAFLGWSGSTVKFIDAEVTTKYPSLNFSVNCFAETPNLKEIILPYRWRTATGIIFPIVIGKRMNIFIRNTKNFMTPFLKPVGASPSFDIETVFASRSHSDEGIEYYRDIYWGWND